MAVVWSLPAANPGGVYLEAGFATLSACISAGHMPARGMVCLNQPLNVWVSPLAAISILVPSLIRNPLGVWGGIRTAVGN